MKPRNLTRIFSVLTLLLAADSAFAGEYTVKGQLRYYDGRSRSATRTVGRYQGAHNLVYRIYDYDQSNADDLLASGVTDGSGRFEKTFSYNQSEGRADIYIKFYYRNSKWTVGNLSDSVYTISNFGSRRTDSNFGTVDFGSLYIPRYGVHEKAMWVFQSMNEGWMYVEAENSWNVDRQVKVRYPRATSGSSFASWMTITIAPNSASSTFTHLHEYGHVINNDAWGESGPGPNYCWGESTTTNCGHHWNSRETRYEGFIEGWANFVALAVLGAVGTDSILDLENRNFNRMSNANEGNVAAFLSDLLDTRYDAHSSSSPGYYGWDFDGRDVLSWNFYGMTWLLSQMQDFIIDRRPGINDYIFRYKALYSWPTRTGWHELFDNNWIISEG